MIQQSHSWAYIQQKTVIQNDTCTPMFITALFTIAKTQKQPKCPSTDDWIKKMWYTHTHNAILLNHKKEWNNAIRSNMDGPGDYHTKWRKPERERKIPYDIIYMWNLKYNTQNRNGLTDIENRLVVAKVGWWGGMEWEFGISRCKLVCIEWISTTSYCIAQGTIFNILW